ncbi:MAG TPA: hypothetical protein VNN62_13900 [Methylomirabilota bacterium]|nr:hypothetical protein [Methylomirabilota bacterium]
MYERTVRHSRLLSKRGQGHIIPLRSAAHSLHARTAMNSPAPPLPSLQEVADTTLHAMQNCLQTMGLGLDLIQMTAPIDPEEFEQIRHNIERASRLVRNLREYCCVPVSAPSLANLAEIVEESVQSIAPQWERPGRTTRIVCHAPLATFTADWRQIGLALARVVSCAYALLSTDGGEVLVESDAHAIGAQQSIDIQVYSTGAAPLSFEEQGIFAPFAYINGHQFGLSLVLARLAAHRLRGRLRFRKMRTGQGLFTLQFRV